MTATQFLTVKVETNTSYNTLIYNEAMESIGLITKLSLVTTSDTFEWVCKYTRKINDLGDLETKTYHVKKFEMVQNLALRGSSEQPYFKIYLGAPVSDLDSK